LIYTDFWIAHRLAGGSLMKEDENVLTQEHARSKAPRGLRFDREHGFAPYAISGTVVTCKKGARAFVPWKGVGKMQGQDIEPTGGQSPLPDENPSAAVIEQLRRILDSHAFSNSPRAKEFLSYVVENGLTGHTELLKERSIGINLFHRPPSYVTSDDPIVRVKAGEVRRRLAQYYAEGEHSLEVQIEIPVGSYIPKFHWKNQPVHAPLALGVEVVEQPLAPPKRHERWKIWGFAAALTIVVITGTTLIRVRYHAPSTLDLFWEPLSATKQPVLICVPSPVGYAVNSELFQQSPAAHSGIYDSLAKRNATPLQLDPNTSIKWKEITPLDDYYVNKDDAYAAEELSVFFAAEHRSTQVRLGSDYTYEDLRSSPAILVGAYNNPWMDRVMSDLPIGFHESGEILWIEDRTKAGQVWKASTDGRRGSKDFALVARVLNSKTGQFLIILSGVGMVGTKAAGDFITHEGDLETALRATPGGWERKNIEVVLETDVVDGSPSPPRAVAVKVW